ncbi:MAG: glycosyltransferase [Acidimicrobiales bacterium]
MPGRLPALSAGDDGDLGQALSAWISGAGAGPEPAAALLVAGELGPGGPGEPDEHALVDLLCGPLGVGAVVPMLCGEHGQVVEAGTFSAPNGAVVPFGPWMSVAAPEVAFRRDVPASASPVVAVSNRALEGLGGGGRGRDRGGGRDRDQGEDQAGARGLGIAEVLAHVRSGGWRIVYEPSWRVGAPAGLLPAPAPAGPRRWAERDEACPARVLVVTGTIPGTLAGAGGLRPLVETLACCPATRATLACADGFGAERYAGWYRAQGVEVVAGPQDWLGWCGDRRYHYSHVVVSDEGLTTRLWPIVRSTQPQALAVLYSERLPFRRDQARAGASRRREEAGTVAEALQASLLRQVEGIEAAWCASRADAGLLAGLGRGVKVVTLGPALPGLGVAKGFADREGVALVATDSFDVASDPEAPALRALGELVPAWRRRDISLKVKVVSDWPTPGLAQAAARVGAEIIPSGGDLAGVLSEARLVAAPLGHGTSVSSWAPAAMAAGTPWLCTPEATAASFLEDLEGLGGRAVVADVATMGHQGWALLSDEAAWEEFSEAMAAARARGVARHRRALRDALVSVGIDPPGAPLWPMERFPAHPARPPAAVPLRPPAVADPPAIFVPDSLSEDERYELWHRRRGPGNAEVVAAIGAEAAGAAYQPTVSVLMPVADTEPWMLEEAVGSVLAQAYPNWELCLADDGSKRPETLAALERAVRRDGRVKLTRLEQRSGISAATNAALGLATGDYVGFLDHDDVLKPHALAQVVRWLNAEPTTDMVYSDEDKLGPGGKLTEARWKPDWSPNLLLCQNYVCHFLVLRRSLVESLGGLRPDYDGSQDYDLVLRVAERTDRIAHIPDCLYSWRMHARSTASVGEHKPWAWLAAQRALGDWLARREARGGTGGWAEEGAWFDVHRVRFRRLGEPKVSIVIPTRNGRALLERCVESVVSKSVYANFELVVVDNQSDEPETLEYLATLPGRVLRYPHEFNYPRQLNLAAASVCCDLLVFLNNDTVVMTSDWLDRLVEQAMRAEVGAVGPRLLLPSGGVQHEGIIVGAWRGHANSIEWGNWWRMGDLARDVSAVTGACMATRPGVYWRVGGYDERLRVAYNDVDYCLRLHQAGYQVVYEPDAALFHAEGSTRGLVEDPDDAPLFNDRWRPRSSCDPYYNPNLNRNRLLFRVEP